MSEQPLISIIVPIYNVEKYLVKCIESIINQTLSNIEIILVDDGSTDNCGIIIDGYAKKDSRIKVIYKNNGGQSSARNMGLDIARGKYIGFVDSDDWIDNDMYENLYKSIIESNADICVCGRQACLENGEVTNKNCIDNELIDFGKKSLKEYIVDRLFYKHTVVVWNKLYKKEIIDNNSIRFEDVSYIGSEDTLFNYQILCHTKKIRAIDKICYTQLSRYGSTARSYKYGYISRTGNLLKCMDNYSKKTQNESLAKAILPIFLLFFHQWNISQIKTYSNKDIFKLISKELNYGMKIGTLRYYATQLVFSKSVSDNMKRMGFKLRGRLLIRTIMGLSILKQYNLATRLILMR